MKTTVLLCLVLLVGCASAPVLVCPDQLTAAQTERLPACDANLEGCVAFDGEDAFVCQGGKWVPLQTE